MPDVSSDAHEAEYRQRLQAALGPGFELRGLIGRGGFGAVYAARDTRLERDVAVKALRHDLFPTPVVLERFQREARALAQLRHPHILPVYAVGSGDGIAYMVMPFIRGETLGDMLRRGDAIPLADALRFTAEIARALDEAHCAGIVHRDVKPDNILIEGPDRHAVLSDFGIARAGASDLTGSGVALGSPQYMSPEQASAEKDIDARSDIYSLGAVAYEMLSGRRPYEADSLQRLLVLQFTTEPTPLHVIARGVPATVSAAVMRALARDPLARFQTAGEFGAQLVLPAPDAVAAERESWFARRGLLLYLLNLLGAYVAIVAMVLLAGSGTEPPIRTAVSLLLDPWMLVFRVLVLAFLAELVVVVWRARRGRTDGSWWPALRDAFGQPRWWQPWYPRRLRSPDCSWDLMPFTVKALRTLLWLGLASLPFAVSLIFGIPRLQGVAAGANLVLPLPARIVIAISGMMKSGPGYVAIALIPAGIAVLAWRHRVHPLDVLRLLLTWRRAAWESAPAQRLRTARS